MKKQMTFEVEKLVSGLSLIFSKNNSQELSRITHCIDCDKKISTARRWQTNCQRCQRCAMRFYRKELKRAKNEV